MKRRLWGLILLALGILILLQLTGVYNLGLSFWPVILLLIGIAILWESIGHGFNSWFLLGLGLWIGGIGFFGILSGAGVSSLSGSDIARYGWPLLLVAIGLSILIGDRNWFGGWRGCGSWSEGEKRGDCSRMRHIGDLYHGRAPWVLDKNLDFYHGIGDVVIDLTTAEIRPGSHRIFIKAGIGEVTVRVPGGVNLEIDTSVGIGELDLFGEQRSGFTGLSLSRTIEVDDAEASLKIEAKLGIGDMTVLYLPAIPGSLR
jgi:lia operon protein LiaF